MTKPTNEERREVAARLRELERQYVGEWGVVKCGELPAPVDDAMHACGIGRAVYGFEIFHRLADLIEPAPERTCRDEGTSAFRCGRCGAFALRDAITDLCGPIPIRYCPNCGARVEVVGR